MGFSYGEKVTEFIPLTKKATSKMFYEGSKANPQATSFVVEFKTEADAQKASKCLKGKWGASRNHRVESNGKVVTW